MWGQWIILKSHFYISYFSFLLCFELQSQFWVSGRYSPQVTLALLSSSTAITERANWLPKLGFQCWTFPFWCGDLWGRLTEGQMVFSTESWAWVTSLLFVPQEFWFLSGGRQIVWPKEWVISLECQDGELMWFAHRHLWQSRELLWILLSSSIWWPLLKVLLFKLLFPPFFLVILSWQIFFGSLAESQIYSDRHQRTE